MADYKTLIDNSREFKITKDQAELLPYPLTKTAIITCMDCRIDPAKIFNFHLGHAHVIRNAGALVTGDVIRSLSISQVSLQTEAVILMKHTGCGLIGLDDESFNNRIYELTGFSSNETWGGFHSLEQSLTSDITKLKESPLLIRKENIIGAIYDITTGALTVYS